MGGLGYVVKLISTLWHGHQSSSWREERGVICLKFRVEVALMTRYELLQLLIAQARSNGFSFRRWYTSRLELSWENTSEATKILSEQRRYYALLFSKDFAETFWKAGTLMALQLPSQSFERRMADGTIRTVYRRGFTRRLTRPDAWRYHLRQMAIAEEPLRYMRRFLRTEEELEPEPKIIHDPRYDPRFIIDEEDLLQDDEA